MAGRDPGDGQAQVSGVVSVGLSIMLIFCYG